MGLQSVRPTGEARGACRPTVAVPSGHRSVLSIPVFSMMPTPKEVDRLTGEADRLMQIRNYSPRTRESYRRWIERFLGRLPSRPIEAIRRRDVEAFLAELAQNERLAPKTRNQAASALAFVFREVLGRDELRTMPRARQPKRIPVVLSHRQVKLVLGQLSGKYRILAGLMYGSGLRLTEAHRLRVKDIDFDLMQISVLDGKGGEGPMGHASRAPRPSVDPPDRPRASHARG